jgi:hypothetical protein
MKILIVRIQELKKGICVVILYIFFIAYRLYPSSRTYAPGRGLKYYWGPINQSTDDSGWYLLREGIHAEDIESRMSKTKRPTSKIVHRWQWTSADEQLMKRFQKLHKGFTETEDRTKYFMSKYGWVFERLDELSQIKEWAKIDAKDARVTMTCKNVKKRTKLTETISPLPHQERLFPDEESKESQTGRGRKLRREEYASRFGGDEEEWDDPVAEFSQPSKKRRLIDESDIEPRFTEPDTAGILGYKPKNSMVFDPEYRKVAAYLHPEWNKYLPNFHPNSPSSGLLRLKLPILIKKAKIHENHEPLLETPSEHSIPAKKKVRFAETDEVFTFETWKEGSNEEMQKENQQTTDTMDWQPSQSTNVNLKNAKWRMSSTSREWREHIYAMEPDFPFYPNVSATGSDTCPERIWTLRPPSQVWDEARIKLAEQQAEEQPSEESYFLPSFYRGAIVPTSSPPAPLPTPQPLILPQQQQPLWQQSNLGPGNTGLPPPFHLPSQGPGSSTPWQLQRPSLFSGGASSFLGEVHSRPQSQNPFFERERRTTDTVVASAFTGDELTLTFSTTLVAEYTQKINRNLFR